jgi:peroxiredoxin Q/BCP
MGPIPQGRNWLPPSAIAKRRQRGYGSPMKKQLITALFALTSLARPAFGLEPELKAGDTAPSFTLKNQDGKLFDMAQRRDKWTVLYFYPKADTPGCTKQACAFRDNIKKITSQGADVFGISVNSVDDQAAFHKKYHLVFDLLADEKGTVADQYRIKMPVINIAKRWTFIIGPDLKIKSIRKNVDPAVDAQAVADELARLKKS